LDLRPGRRIFVQTAIASQPIEYALPTLLKELRVGPRDTRAGDERNQSASLTFRASYPLLGLLLSQSCSRNAERPVESGDAIADVPVAKFVRDLILTHAVPPVSVVTLRTINGKLRGLETPGATPFRSVLTWVDGRVPSSAALVPAPPGEIEEYIADLVEFIGRDDVAENIWSAMVYYQLLVVHPFKDANGRLARLLLALKSWRRQSSCSKGIVFAAALNTLKYDVARHFSKVFDGNADEYLKCWRKIESWSDSVAELAVRSLLQMHSALRERLGPVNWLADFVKLVELCPAFSHAEFKSVTRGSDRLASRYCLSLEQEQTLTRIDAAADKWVCEESRSHWNRVRSYAMTAERIA